LLAGESLRSITRDLNTRGVPEIHAVATLPQEARAAIESGALANLVTLNHELAQVYVGAGTKFPPMPDRPPGFVMHIAVARVGGFGPWMG
jgi:hypothetical protein